MGAWLRERPSARACPGGESPVNPAERAVARGNWPTDTPDGAVASSWMGPDMTEGQRAHAGNAGADGRGSRRGSRRGSKSVVPPGVWVDDSDEDDPLLRNADGSLVDTWREEYPYPERLTREEYDHIKRGLQIELLKMQYWVRETGGRFVVVFEGRDAAGKGSTIKRFME